MTKFETNRRTALKLVLASGALTLMVPRALFAASQQELTYQADGMTVPLLIIHADNSATIMNVTPDMGQGTSTSMPMILAEEFDLDWERVTVDTLPLRRSRNAEGQMRYRYHIQGAGGSVSTRYGWEPLRTIGAQGRDMFVRAAAGRWGVAPTGLITEKAVVKNPMSGKSLKYAHLLDDVAKLSPRDDVPLKARKDYRIIGTAKRMKAVPDIIKGKAVFGIDQQTEGMLHAVIERCPHFRGQVRMLDDSAARQVAGVHDIIIMEWQAPDSPVVEELVAGVAVVADSLWAAKKARELLEIEWDAGPYAGYSSAEAEARSHAMLASGEGFDVLDYDGNVRNFGDVEAAFGEAAQTHEAIYTVRHIAHALMEPHSTVADVRLNEAFVKAPTQSLGRVQDIASIISGIPAENIHVELGRPGGSFGRRYNRDYVAEAVWLSKTVRKPVKVTWMREDELTQCRYRAANNYKMKGGVDESGKLIALEEMQASPYQSFDPDVLPPVGWMYEDLTGFNFETGIIPNHVMKQKFFPGPVPRGPWRAPGSINSAFAQLSFLDELAEMAGKDTLEFMLSVLGDPRTYGTEEYPMDTGRMAACYRLAAEKAGWGKKLPKGHGMGIAGYYSHQSYVAHVVEARVDDDGHITVDKVTSAADCGLVVNPNGVRAQIEGAIHDALSVALGQEITVVNAAVQQSNFHEYDMARMDRSVKEIDIHIIEGADSPTGMGEPAMPPFAPALMGAIYRATGKRIRRLPIADQLSA